MYKEEQEPGPKFVCHHKYAKDMIPYYHKGCFWCSEQCWKQEMAEKAASAKQKALYGFKDSLVGEISGGFSHIAESKTEVSSAEGSVDNSTRRRSFSRDRSSRNRSASRERSTSRERSVSSERKGSRSSPSPSRRSASSFHETANNIIISRFANQDQGNTGKLSKGVKFGRL